MLVELLAVLALHYFEDAIGWKRLLIGALRAHRVVDVGDAAQHRADVESGAAHADRIPRAVEPEMMLEGDHGRDRRHFRRAAQNLRAVHDMHPHDRKFRVGQLVRLVEDFGGRPHLADVVHQCRKTELAQLHAVDADRARLRHGEDRDIHHVREGVVVVVLEGGQRDQRRAIR